MEKRLLIFCCLLLLAVSVGSVYYLVSNPGVHDTAKLFNDNSDKTDKEVSVVSLIKPNITRINDDENPHDMRFEFPKNVDTDEIEYTSDYFNNTFEIIVKGIDKLYFSNFPVEGQSDRIDDITYSNQGLNSIIKIKFNKITTIKHTIRDRFLYLDFINPNQFYDRIVVIDPGYGGDEYGIVFDDVYEKDINLGIAKKVNELFENEDKIGLFCTRLSDSNCTIDDRVAFAKSVDANMYISIYQNSTSSGRESDMKGTQVQYFSSDKTGASKELATDLLDNVVKALGSDNIGAIAGDGNELFQKNECPTAIINVGYMTNKVELEQLKSDEYQNKCAQAIYDTIMEKMYENSNSDR